MIFKRLMAAAIEIKIATGSVVQAVTDSPTFTGTAAAHTTAIAATTLELDDFQVIAYNSFGGTVTLPENALSALDCGNLQPMARVS